MQLYYVTYNDYKKVSLSKLQKKHFKIGVYFKDEYEIEHCISELGNNLYKLETIYSVVPTFFKSLKELKEYLKFLKEGNN